MACPNCGSWAVKADRSLAGRMVCARCGQVLGPGQGGRAARGSRAGHNWPAWLALAALVSVSALLATQPQPPAPDSVDRKAVPIR